MKELLAYMMVGAYFGTMVYLLGYRINEARYWVLMFATAVVFFVNSRV